MKIVEIGESNLKIADGNYSSKYPRSEEFITEGVPFIRGNNFENKSISDKDMYFISPEKHSELKKGHVKPKDVLITTRGNIGKVALVPERHDDSNINAQIVLLRCNEGWHPEYLLHTFNSDFVKRQIPGLTTGTALKQLPVKNLKKLKIPLPPLDQQKKIAAILDAADSYRQKTKAVIAKYDELTQSLFLDMFGDPVTNPKGWEILPLKEFGNIVTGNTPSRKVAANYDSKFIEWIKTNNIDSEYTYVTKAKEYLSEEGLKNGRSVKKGSLLVACIAGSIKSIGRASLTDRQVSFNQQINAIEPSIDLNSSFLYYLFRQCPEYIQDHASNGMKRMLSKGDFQKILMIKPPYELQNQFGERIKSIEVQKTQAQASLVQAENLFNSLLQKAFKGELL